MESILSGDWAAKDFKEARKESKALVRVHNSCKRAEHLCLANLKTPSQLNITIEAENRSSVYSVDIQPRDLLVPLYKKASLIWLKLLISKALEGEFPFKLSYLTEEEINVSSIFLTESIKSATSVKEEEASAVQIELFYELEDKQYSVVFQVPKILEDIQESSLEDDFSDYQKIQETLYTLQEENSQTFSNLKKTHKDVLSLKQDLQ